MGIDKEFLIKFSNDRVYDYEYYTRDDIADVLSEAAGDFRFTDGWKLDVDMEISELGIGEEYEVYGQFDYANTTILTIKRIA